MNYTSSPNQRTNSHEATPFESRPPTINYGVVLMRLAKKRQEEQTVNGEVQLVHESFTAKHPAAAMAYREVPNHQAPVVLDESTVRASLDVARGDGRRPAEQVQAPGFNLSRQFLQQNPTVNTNYGYNPGDSTHGAV